MYVEPKHVATIGLVSKRLAPSIYLLMPSDRGAGFRVEGTWGVESRTSEPAHLVVMEVAAPCAIRPHEALPDDTWPLSFNFSGGMLL